MSSDKLELELELELVKSVVFVKLLSGDLIEIDTTADTTCSEFYNMVYTVLREQHDLKINCQCQIKLFLGDEEFVPVGDELLNGKEGEVFCLFVENSRYTFVINNYGDAYDTTVVPVTRYDAMHLMIIKHEDDRKVEYDHYFYVDGSWHGPDDEVWPILRVFDGTDIPFNDGHEDDEYVIQIPEDTAVLTMEEMVERILDTAEPVMRFTMSARTCLRNNILEDYEESMTMTNGQEQGQGQEQAEEED
jgi:hypothetical protein